MTKKHLKTFNICDLPKYFVKQLLKETLRTYQKTPEILKKTCVLLIKLLTLFNYWSNQMEKVIAAVNIFLLI